MAAVSIIGPTKTIEHTLCTIILLDELQAQKWIYNFDENIIIIYIITENRGEIKGHNLFRHGKYLLYALSY